MSDHEESEKSLSDHEESEKPESTTEEAEEETTIRKSAREPKLTPKMADYLKGEFEKLSHKLFKAREHWKEDAKILRGFLKQTSDEETLGQALDKLKHSETSVLKLYEELRNKGTVDPVTVRKIDACNAISSELTKLTQEVISELDIDNQRLKNVRELDANHSIFGDTLTEGGNSEKNSVKIVDAAAEYAASQAAYELSLEQERQKENLARLEFEQKLVVAAQVRKMKNLEIKKQLETSKARYMAYSQALANDVAETHSAVNTPCQVKMPTMKNESTEDSKPAECFTQPAVTTSVKTDSQVSDMKFLAKSIADSVNLNRLPVPEPSVFYGDPIQYIEWKSSFETLIARKDIPQAERIFYLKRYVGGAAKRALEGFFYSDSLSAFANAWKVLQERYGHPFVMQKAFREKLNKWPKIPPKDPIALRDFADFLQGCRDATTRIPSLSILGDCTENQKLISKLPEWATVRWNRIVTETVSNNDRYPSFNEFVEFVVKEAKVACNPVSSLYALSGSDNKNVNKKVKVLATGAYDKSQASNATEGKDKSCHYCNATGHYICKCNDFVKLPIHERRSFVQKSNLCFGCLKKGHINRDCKRKHVCGVCKGRHPTCLHENVYPLQNKTPCNTVQNDVKSATTFRVSGNNGQSTSMIVPVWVSHKKNPLQEILTYALLDTQSDTTFILEDMARALQAPCQQVRLSLSTMAAQNTVINSSKLSDLQVRGFWSTQDEKVSINQAYTREFIPADRSHIPERNTVKDLPHLQEITEELPPLQSCDVGLLIGYNCPKALAPRKLLIGQDDEPYAVQTTLGWSVIGYSKEGQNGYTQVCVSHRTAVKEVPLCTPKDLIKVLERDFVQDSSDDLKVSQEDIKFLSLLDNSIHQREDKHLEMQLPFKERPVLPNNKPQALVRLDHLKRKLKNDKKYYDHYKKTMNDMLARGDAELVSDEAAEGNKWYLPHHGVYHPRKPDTVRVVFDCSARYREASLNQNLLTGPDLTNGLTGVLCRFRRYPVAIMCDIEKMFHQFYVTKTDRDFLRFLWWEGGDINSELGPQEYRMRVHLFGAASSPGCANYGLKYLAKTHEKNFSGASQFIQRDFYVDDGLTSLKTEEEAIQLVEEARDLCATGGLRLHKFISNRRKVIDAIPASERAAEVKELDLALEQLPVEQALGVQWSIENDVFNFSVKIKDNKSTRRNMLSIVASIFDPLGFVAPVVLKGKKLLQEVCRNGVGWDDPLPSSIQPDWKEWLDDIQNLKLVQIPRCLQPEKFSEPSITELHHFSDASNVAYGQCSYIRFVNEEKVHCSLITAKARVAPLRVVTIPRLELVAAVLSAKMSAFLKDELGLKIDKEYFWTDSQVVLGYINNDARRFHTFVANRVQTIKDLTNCKQWFHVNSGDNPADHVSRGLTAAGIVNSTWLTGPAFLWEREITVEASQAELQLGDPEVRVKSLNTHAHQVPNFLDLLKRFSSWPTVVKVCARLQRLSNGIKGVHSPTVEERRKAELTILKLVQKEAYSETVKTLSSSNKLPKTDPLYNLDPVLSDGLLHVGGRLRKAGLSFANKHPVILPKESYITHLILTHVHQKSKHQGRGITLNALRTNGYWIVGGSKVVAKFIRKCVLCRRLRRATETQKMADLPRDRVEPSPPFLYCGMDCFGPFIVKQGRKEVKRYGLLFTCMCSRAVHIEMLDDMTTDAFINGLRCFIAFRGAVRQIRCDRGTNFIGAMNELEREKNLNKVESFLLEKQCDFLFNAPSSSHTGGAWERQIKTVRNVLNSVIAMCPGRLDDASLRTLFYEVMSIVNSRPLSIAEINDPDALDPITPNHILTGKSEIPYPPPGNFVKEDIFLRKRWRRVQYLLQQFWIRWKREYMSEISVRQKWHEKRRNMCVGDIVLVKDVDLSRNMWPLARVEEVSVDDDGLVRRVKVKLARKNSESSSVLERSIHKLVLLMEKS